MIFISLHLQDYRCWNPAPPCGQPLTGVIAFGSDHGVCGRFIEVLAVLLREWFFVELFRVCTESLASEHASRLLAMQAAERYITDRLADLNTVYRQQRQEAITSELLDVVAGFKALAGSRSAQAQPGAVGLSWVRRWRQTPECAMPTCVGMAESERSAG